GMDVLLQDQGPVAGHPEQCAHGGARRPAADDDNVVVGVPIGHWSLSQRAGTGSLPKGPWPVNTSPCAPDHTTGVGHLTRAACAESPGFRLPTGSALRGECAGSG